MDRLRFWRFDFDARSPASTLNVHGGCLRAVHQQGGAIELWMDLPVTQVKLADVGPETAVVYGTGGSVVPCHARRRGTQLSFSNVASELLQSREAVRVNSFAVIQHLLGVPYPQDNLFSDLIELEASGAYEVQPDGQLQYRATKLTPIAGASYEVAMDLIHEQWDQLTRDGRPLCVLLSGGYDSRLNLALALHHAARNGNRVIAYHEYKNELENSIAQDVAAAAGVPLTTRARDHFVGAQRPVESHPRFVLLNSGPYRENLLRWHYYFASIRLEHPQGAVIGFGAEAHKGKFYDQVRDPARDSEQAFGVDAALVRETAARLGIRHYDRNSQRDLFRNLVAHALQLGDLHGQVDFLHYQTYVANGYGKRCHSVWQLFDVAFPFLDERFLQVVFSLPRAEKEGFLITRRAIEELQPKLASIRYTSGNAKALKPYRGGVIRAASRFLRTQARPWVDALTGKRAKGRAGLHPAERLLLEQIQPRSAVTQCLHELARTDMAPAPRARIDYALQLLMYFSQLEKDLGATFEWG